MLLHNFMNSASLWKEHFQLDERFWIVGFMVQSYLHHKGSCSLGKSEKASTVHWADYETPELCCQTWHDLLGS